MFKNIISPIQAWSLSQGHCVGCGRKLSKDGTVITCRCGRIFIYDPVKKNYRRALFNEI